MTFQTVLTYCYKTSVQLSLVKAMVIMLTWTTTAKSFMYVMGLKRDHLGMLINVLHLLRVFVSIKLNSAAMFTTQVVVQKPLGILANYDIEVFRTEFDIHHSRDLRMIIGYFTNQCLTIKMRFKKNKKIFFSFVMYLLEI